MRLTLKEAIRFEVSADPSPTAVVEIRVRPSQVGWEARAVVQPADGSPTLPLPRVFRSRDRTLAVGKMAAWVRRRFGGARPIAELRMRPRPDAS